MSHYEVVIQPDGRAALVLRIEPPQIPGDVKEDHPEDERGVVIIDPYEDLYRDSITYEM
jgi:hypothetical protein